MKHIPILFSTEMVQAIIAGRKTQTRRIVKMRKAEITDAKWGYTTFTPERHISVRGVHANGQYGESFIPCPYGQVGDILWVRETWACAITTKRFWHFKADGEKPTSATKWKPSIHMPKAAARIWLKIVSLKVERLQQINEKDALHEGVEHSHHFFKDYLPTHQELAHVTIMTTAQASFRTLWQSINGFESWDANPWVWVIEFKRIPQPKNPLSIQTPQKTKKTRQNKKKA